jgi:hypothetical protein
MLAGFASACTPVRHILDTADPLAMCPPARPDLFAGLPDDPAGRQAAWEIERPRLLAALEGNIYGAAPANPAAVTLGAWQAVRGSLNPGESQISEVRIESADGDALTLTLALVMPEDDGLVRGVVLAPSECGLQAVLHDPAMPAPDVFTPGYCDAEGGWLWNLLGGLFGEWISGPPVEQLLARGYAVAAWHESEIAPDSAAHHEASLERLGLDPAAPDRPGVISVWAWTISRAADALRSDPRLSDAPLIAYGHSRRGKAVLLAAARDERIAITIAHQAGTGGAALHGDGVGEPLAAITENYPHWFAPAYASYAGRERALPIDQHALLALIAPRSVLLGAAWRDTWADPAGAFRAAEAASPAWGIYNEPGLIQTRLADLDPSGHVASHIRPGTHGVSQADWDAFLAFMDAHTQAP